VPSAIPHAVAEAFGLVGVRVIDEFESWGNRNLLVEAGGQRYVMRQHQLNANARRLELQLLLHEHLVSRGFPAATIVPTREGKLFALDGDEKPWALS
jgi:Ser/Thr protein kinase RdoA (MazF antagonist)